jgi:hypothetical protein
MEGILRSVSKSRKTPSKWGSFLFKFFMAGPQGIEPWMQGLESWVIAA